MTETELLAPLRGLLFALPFAVPAVAAAGPTNVPFSGTLTTQEVLHPDPSACPTTPFLAGTTTGSGQASHLGAVIGTATDCVTPTSPVTYSFTNGNLVVTAANGDQLRVQYAGTLAPTATQPIFAITGTYRIVGGTGRFASASGTGAIGGVENLATGQGQLSLNGTISY